MIVKTPNIAWKLRLVYNVQQFQKKFLRISVSSKKHLITIRYSPSDSPINVQQATPLNVASSINLFRQ